jgi:alpha-L-rhamnosidase
VLYLHRQIAGEDVFLVSNQRRRAEDVLCTFRVAAGRPELWDAECGSISEAPSYNATADRTHVRLSLDPASSVFVIFRRRKHSLSSTETKNRVAAAKTLPPLSVPSSRDFVGDFCMAVWVQPETYIMPGTSFVAIPEEGTLVYGSGHTIAGFTVGQNGVWVYERTSGAPRVVLEVVMPMPGLAHVAIVYQAGRPTIFVDGIRVVVGRPSASMVHPVRDCKSRMEPPRYFEGNMTLVEVTDVRSSEELSQTAARGVPP